MTSNANQYPRFDSIIPQFDVCSWCQRMFDYAPWMQIWVIMKVIMRMSSDFDKVTMQVNEKWILEIWSKNGAIK